eukprot:1910192-Amphidinium_carterae.2
MESRLDPDGEHLVCSVTFVRETVAVRLVKQRLSASELDFGVSTPPIRRYLHQLSLSNCWQKCNIGKLRFQSFLTEACPVYFLHVSLLLPTFIPLIAYVFLTVDKFITNMFL